MEGLPSPTSGSEISEWNRWERCGTGKAPEVRSHNSLGRLPTGTSGQKEGT